MATLGAPAGAAAEDGGYDGRHEEHESLAVLAARYGSGSESEGEEGERAGAVRGQRTVTGGGWQVTGDGWWLWLFVVSCETGAKEFRW